MEKLRGESWLVGAVLGIVWLVIGLNYGNSALIILGVVCLALGAFLRFRRSNPKQYAQPIPCQSNRSQQRRRASSPRAKVTHSEMP